MEGRGQQSKHQNNNKTNKQKNHSHACQTLSSPTQINPARSKYQRPNQTIQHQNHPPPPHPLCKGKQLSNLEQLAHDDADVVDGDALVAVLLDQPQQIRTQDLKHHRNVAPVRPPVLERVEEVHHLHAAPNTPFAGHSQRQKTRPEKPARKAPKSNACNPFFFFKNTIKHETKQIGAATNRLVALAIGVGDGAQEINLVLGGRRVVLGRLDHL